MNQSHHQKNFNRQLVKTNLWSSNLNKQKIAQSSQSDQPIEIPEAGN